MDAPRLSRFAETSAKRAIRVSFEFFPPRTEDMEQTLWEAIGRLAPLLPHFVSVTYGAGGSTRERTHATVKRILTETMLTPAAHLTCVAASRAEVDAVIGAYAHAGVRHIVALRGDPVGGIGEKYAPHPGGYRNAADLVTGIKRIADIEVSVSAYPEKHLTARASPPTSTCSRPRSMPEHRAPLPNSFSRTVFTSAISTACAPQASKSRSCPAFCRCKISSRPGVSPRVPALRSRIGWRHVSTASTMILRLAN